MDPLFSDEPDDRHEVSEDTHYLLPSRGKHIQPLKDPNAQAAAELIRRKLDALYSDEPNAKQDLAEAEAEPHRSKHQQFMHDLSVSGRSLAEIQTAWHNYYVALPDQEKHQVWREFYAANARAPSAYAKYVRDQTTAKQHATAATHEDDHKPVVGMPAPDHEHERKEHETGHAASDKRDIATVKKQIVKKVRAKSQARIKAKQHVQSLVFGIATGSVVILIFLFGFFNEMVITPFIRPGARANATPIILNTDAVAPSETPEVIIPKINVQLPVVYGSQTVNETDLQRALEEGVIHYPTTFVPGQRGNAAFFGHSSNNIFNKGKYKFAFVLLHELEPGDIFYVSYGKKLYTYKVFVKRVVEPHDTWVLNDTQGKTATVALITCDPPGTSSHRLVVWGEQINPSPDGNIAAEQPQVIDNTPKELPSNGPTLWSRFWGWLF